MANKTILSLIQTFSREKGLKVPSAVFAATTDAAMMQLMEVVNKVGRDLADYAGWQVLKRRKTFASIANEDQGLLATLLAEDPAYVSIETLWDNTTRLPIYGPLNDEQYQQTLAMLPQGPLYQFKVYQDHLHITGGISAGHTLAVIYKSSNWLQTTSSSGVFIPEIAADTNCSVFDDQLMLLGIDYFYRKVKELPFQAAYADYEAKKVDASGSDSIKPILNMSGPNQPLVRPAILVPAGSWDTTTLP